MKAKENNVQRMSLEIITIEMSLKDIVQDETIFIIRIVEGLTPVHLPLIEKIGVDPR
jgi:hypothetical protein